MPENATIKALNDWKQEATAPLKVALEVSKDVFGREAPDACKHAVILMAQSAAKLAPKSRTQRQVVSAAWGKYVDTYQQGKREPTRLWKHQFDDPKRYNLTGTWEQAKKIGNRGLGSRSWMWQLGGNRAPIPGASYVSAFKAGEKVGYVKRNKLSYIDKIMPTGWLAEVERLATNKIMGQAFAKLQKAQARAMERASR